MIVDILAIKQKSVVKHFFTTAADGKKYSTNFNNLDVISVGYPLMAHDDVDVGATGRSPLRGRG